MKFSEFYKHTITEARIYNDDKIGMKYVLTANVGMKNKELTQYGSTVFERLPNTGKHTKASNVVVLGKSPAKGIAYFKDESGQIYRFLGLGTANFREYKSVSSMGSTSFTGAEYESLITYYHNKELGVKEANNIIMAGVQNDTDLLGRITSDFGKKLGELYADKTVSDFGEPLKQTGASTINLSPFWVKHGGSDTTPKTDILSKSNKSRFSVKKSGGSQLLSAKHGEASATFDAALDALQNQKEGASPEIIKAIKILTNPKKWADAKDSKKRTVTDIKNLLDPATTAELNKTKVNRNWSKIKKGMAKVKGEFEQQILQGILNNHQLENALQTAMESDPRMKYEFTKEAMTGDYKFGKKSIGAANSMLIFNQSGDADIIKIAKPLISKYAKKVNYKVSFKTSGRSYTAIRGELKECISSELEMLDMLNEGFLKDTFDKVKDAFGFVTQIITSILKKIATVIINAAKSGYKNLLELFGIETVAEVSSNPVITL
tara:strand:+ start:589 stop:2061 length:1473 start_codon:yes stop_codon:yes gene_type:complete